LARLVFGGGGAGAGGGVNDGGVNDDGVDMIDLPKPIVFTYEYI
jgi:hypothetical protein